MVGCVDELLLILEPDPLPQNTKVEKDCLLLLVCVPEFVWSDVAASLLEGFLGIAAESGAGLAALKACELLSGLMLACSWAIALMRKEDHLREDL